MSTHLHNPVAEMGQALRTFRGFLLAGALSVALWSVIFVAVLALEYGIGVR
jgi:hypothetical protein